MNILLAPSTALASFLEQNLKPGFEVLAPGELPTSQVIDNVVMIVTHAVLESEKTQKVLSEIIPKATKNGQVFVLLV